MQVEQPGAQHLGAGARLAPGQRVQAVTDPRLHQPVPGRMELHLIDAVAVAVVAVQLGRLAIGGETGGQQRAAGQLAVLRQARLAPAGTEALQPLLQRPVAAVQIAAVQRRRLVGDCVGFRVLLQTHRPPPARCICCSEAEERTFARPSGRPVRAASRATLM
ncbi:hypothetical protein D3C78_1391260 [compost metagenome]